MSRGIVRGWLSSWYTYVQDVLSPPYCAYCWMLLERRTPLCTVCIALIKPIVSFDLVVNASCTCTVYALSAYDDPLKLLIRAKQNRSPMGAQQLGVLMVEKLTPELLTADDVLVPVPLHWQRYAWRGFNQAQVIAEVIARVHGVEVLPLVVRTKKTIYQAEAGAREARRVNVYGAFMWNARYNPQEYGGKRLVFIDDLMTTGSTLRMVIQSVLKAYQQDGLTAPPVAAFVAARVTT